MPTAGMHDTMSRWAGILLVLIIALGSGCQSEGPNQGTTLNDIDREPEQYYDQSVVVSGEIDATYGSSFTIGGDTFGSELLIVVPPTARVQGGRSGSTAFGEDDIVQVEGTIRNVNAAEIEADVGVQLDPGIVYDERQHVLVARQIFATPRMSRAAVSDSIARDSMPASSSAPSDAASGME